MAFMTAPNLGKDGHCRTSPKGPAPEDGWQADAGRDEKCSLQSTKKNAVCTFLLVDVNGHCCRCPNSSGFHHAPTANAKLFRP